MEPFKNEKLPNIWNVENKCINGIFVTNIDWNEVPNPTLPRLISFVDSCISPPQ